MLLEPSAHGAIFVFMVTLVAVVGGWWVGLRYFHDRFGVTGYVAGILVAAWLVTLMFDV